MSDFFSNPWVQGIGGLAGMYLMGKQDPINFANVDAQFTDARTKLDNLEDRAGEYTDITSNIYSQGRNLISGEAQKQNALNQLLAQRRSRSQGGSNYGQYSAANERQMQEMGTRNMGTAMDQMSKMYVQGQGTADSLLSNVASGYSQIGNALATMKYDQEKHEQSQYMDFLSGIFSFGSGAGGTG